MLLLTALVAHFFPLRGLVTAASCSMAIVSSLSESWPSIIWKPLLVDSTFVVILTLPDRTELPDNQVLALVRGGTLMLALRRVLVLCLLVGFT